MTQIGGGSDWIGAYLEWTDAEFGMSRELFAAPGMDAGDGSAEDTAAVYLDWIDTASTATQREAVLLMALRAESECMHMLRQALDDGRPTSRTLRLAMEALDCAKHLVDDERRAWQTLNDLCLAEQPLAWIAWGDDSRMDWPCALEDVEADMRALSGRILELRAH